MPRIIVYCDPVPKARPRVVTMRGGARAFTPRTTVNAEAQIRAAWVAAGHGLLRGPLRLQVIVGLRRPRFHYGRRGILPSAPVYPDVQPDWDNYAKTVCDALQGVAYRNDGQIVSAGVDKLYADPGSLFPTVGWLIQLREMNHDEQ